MYYASKSGNQSVVEELLKQGVDNVDTKDSDGRTALWTASFDGHSDVVELLLSHGADTEVRDEDGDTALHVACYKGHLNVVKCLIQARAVNAKNRNGSVTFSHFLRIFLQNFCFTFQSGLIIDLYAIVN